MITILGSHRENANRTARQSLEDCWRQVCRLEPRLIELAVNTTDLSSWCDKSGSLVNRHSLWPAIRSELENLLGPESQDPRLRDPQLLDDVGGYLFQLFQGATDRNAHRRATNERNTAEDVRGYEVYHRALQNGVE